MDSLGFTGSHLDSRKGAGQRGGPKGWAHGCEVYIRVAAVFVQYSAAPIGRPSQEGWRVNLNLEMVKSASASAGVQEIIKFNRVSAPYSPLLRAHGISGSFSRKFTSSCSSPPAPCMCTMIGLQTSAMMWSPKTLCFSTKRIRRTVFVLQCVFRSSLNY